MENYISLILLFIAGYGLRRLPAFPKDTSTALNLFVIYVSLPAMILHRVPKLTLSGDVIVAVATPWVMLTLSALAVLAISRALRWSRSVTGALLLVVPLGNTSFLGIPMVTNFFSAQAVSYALLYDQLGTFIGLATYGTYVLALYSGAEKPSVRMIATKMLTFPPFIALLVALATGSLHYPPALDAALKNISASLVPVVMVAIGFQLKLSIPRHYLAPLGIGLTLKLAVAPVVALLICRALHIQGIMAEVSIFEAGMPPMVTAGALAIMGGLAVDLAAAMIGYGLVLAFVTLPILHWLIRTLL